MTSTETHWSVVEISFGKKNQIKNQPNNFIDTIQVSELKSSVLSYNQQAPNEILMFVSNKPTKSREILVFVCLQKDAKQCCDATKLDCTHCTGQSTPKMKANAIPRLLSSLV